MRRPHASGSEGKERDEEGGKHENKKVVKERQGRAAQRYKNRAVVPGLWSSPFTHAQGLNSSIPGKRYEDSGPDCEATPI